MLVLFALTDLYPLLLDQKIWLEFNKNWGCLLKKRFDFSENVTFKVRFKRLFMGSIVSILDLPHNMHKYALKIILKFIIYLKKKSFVGLEILL